MTLALSLWKLRPWQTGAPRGTLELDLQPPPQARLGLCSLCLSERHKLDRLLKGGELWTSGCEGEGIPGGGDFEAKALRLDHVG